MSMRSLSGRAWAPYRKALADERALTRTLQRLIEPAIADTRQSHGLWVSGRIVSADRGPRVCGDWYLTLPLPDGSLFLAVGDVAGHGLSAAAAMMELRYAMAAYASEALPPAPVDAEFTWASAGHPPILLAYRRGVSVLPNPDGALLGAGLASAFREDRMWLRPGERVICYTDGMLGREHLDTAVADLAGQVGRGLDKPGHLLDHLAWPSSSRFTDDACVLVAERIR